MSLPSTGSESKCPKALTVQLNDSGFLILLHSSQFLTYEDAGTDRPEVVQGMFVFPDSRAIQRDTKVSRDKSCFSPEVLQILPALSYAETELEKCPPDLSGELYGQMEQHIQSYAALIHPGLASPSREASIFPDQYDVPEYLYSPPVWTELALQHLKSYLHDQAPYQLSVSRATELLAAGREKRDEQDEDVYYCLSSPEADSTAPSWGPEDQTGGESSSHADTPKDSNETDTGAKDKENSMHAVEVPVKAPADLSQPAVLAEHLTATAVCNTADSLTEMPEVSTLPTSSDLPTELVVSITSAQSTETVLPVDETGGPIHAASANSDSGLQSSSFPPAKLQVEGETSSNGEFVKANQPSELPKVSTLAKEDWRRRPRKRRKRKALLKAAAKEPKLPLKDDWRRRPRVPRTFVDLHVNDEEAKRVLRSAHKVKEKEPEMEDTDEPPVHTPKRKRHKESEEDNVVATPAHPLKRNTDKEPEKVAKKRVITPAHPLKRKTDQWDLKAITTKCGRIFVPHGSGDLVKDRRPLEEKRAINNDLLIKRSDTNDHSIDVAQVSTTEETASALKDDGKKRDVAALSLSKLKNVISRVGKRTTSLSDAEDQSLVKKNKADTGTDQSECVNMSEADSLETTVGAVPESQPLDPALAHALGLAPKGLNDESRKTPNKNTQLKKDHPGEGDPDAPQATSDTKSQRMPFAIGRMRALQMRGVSADAIKKKWWLHFHTPASYASATLAKTKSQQHLHSSHSVRKGHSLKGRESGADPPAPALSLLADLALGGSNEELLPDPALENKRDPSLEKGECLNSAGSLEPESVLHDLLRCPTAKSSRPPKSSSPEGLAGSPEVVVLISTEHSYSLPPSSLPLGLSGALLHVSPISSSEGLQQHRKNIYGDGTNALRAFTGQEDKITEELENAPEHPTKGTSRKRKFRRSRNFVEKDGSIQVTRWWKENYDFHLDSKFTNHPKEKAVNRALHGTWDFNIKDTNDQIQLIIHMWIGLFYSRSTARFFQIEPGHTLSDCDALDLSKGGQKETPNLGSEVLDLSMKNTDLDLTVDRKDSGEKPPVSHKDREVVENVPSSSDVVGDMSDKTKQLDDEEGSKSSLQKVVGLGATDLKSLEMGGSILILCETTGNIMYPPEEDVPKAHSIGKALEGRDIPGPKEVERKCDGKQNLSEVEMVQPTEGDNAKACTEAETSEGSHVVQTVTHDENKSRDDDRIEETQKQDHKEKGDAEADPHAMDLGTSLTNKNISSEALQPTRDGNGSDPRENVPIELCKKNTPGVEKPTAVGNENVTMVQIPLKSHEKEPGQKSQFAVQRRNDSRDKSLHVLSNGPASVDEESSAVQEGNAAIDDALPVENGEEDVCVGATPSETLDETKRRQEVLPENKTAPVGETNMDDQDQTEISVLGVGDITDEVAVDSNKDITHTKISHPQCEKSEAVQDQKEMPLIQADSNTDASISEVGVDSSMGVTHTETSYSQDDTSDLVQGHIKIPLIGEGIHGEVEADLGRHRIKIPLIEGISTPHTNSAEKEMSYGTNSLGAEMLKMCFLSDKRCPTPTVDERPYDPYDIPYSDNLIVSAAYDSDGNTGKEYARGSTPTQDELPFDHRPLEDGHSVKTVLLPNSEGSSLALEKERVHEHDMTSPSSVEKMLRELRGSHNKPNSVEQTADPSLVSTNRSPNVHSTSSEEEYCVRTPAQLGRYTSLSIESLARLYDSSPKNLFTEYHSNRASNSSELSLEGDASFYTESSCNSSTFVSDKFALPDLATHNSNELNPYSLRPVMAVKPSKNDESNGDLGKEGQIKYTLTPEVLKTLQFSISAHANTTVPITSTPFATEVMKRQSESYSGVSEETERVPKEQHIARKTHFDQHQEWDTQTNEVLDSNRPSTSSSLNLTSIESGKNVSQTQMDWYSYCHSEESGKSVKSWIDENEEDFSVAMSSIVTVLDHKGNRVTYENPIGNSSQNMHSRTIRKPNTTGSNRSLEEFSKKWTPTQTDLTQSSLDQECLIFSEKMSHMLKAERRGSSHDKTSSSSRLRQNRSNEESPTGGIPVTVCFSNLKEQDGSEDHWGALPSLVGQTIQVVMPERSSMADRTGGDTHLHLQKLSCAKVNEAAHAKVSDMAAECARSYSSMMDDVCAGKALPPKVNIKNEGDSSRSRSSNNSDLCGQMRREMYDNLHDQLNSVVRQSCKIKFRFFMLVTSDDPFYKRTKELLEAEGHCEVGPHQFFLDEDGPLLIILRNEDIAEHICEVPYLLDLKKSPSVLFAGIDQADDIVNLTHQELFTKGGFVVFEGAALEVLSLCNMKRMSSFLEEMSKKGKWKWMIHYRDSRLLKEQARLSAEAQERKQFLDSCQGAGIVEVLPYHECDVISIERPNYLDCLIRLQVQNISARFPVFITDTTADNAFGKHGIMTMNINSFLLISQSDSCTIS